MITFCYEIISSELGLLVLQIIYFRFEFFNITLGFGVLRGAVDGHRRDAKCGPEKFSKV
jgi:hypothetical protein